MDQSKAVLPFTFTGKYEQNPTDVSSYLSSVRIESDYGTQVHFVKSNIHNNNHLLDKKSPKANLISNDNDSTLDDNLKKGINNYLQKKSQDNSLTLLITSSNYKQWKTKILKKFQNDKAQLNFCLENHQSNDQLDTEIDIPTNFTQWRSFLITTIPTPYIISILSFTEFITLITYYKKFISKKNKGHLNNWLISILLRLPEILTYNDLNELRELGKKIKFLRLKSFSSPEDFDTDTLMTYDMSLAIISDLYGQKDLLND
ncbi:Brr1p ASCRUDRAFT_8850 [Ascoidea rubescens DSM 1968]|uniref:Uncharacterized protein n=1 Tax=Ascoidea rubescens DSM 1968 TaxID=1344418 RepID=A0A1D2VEY2_9ASCO|nr:hypothetical protein ASCRUDRAFT_8850 [Ascoidea rubescens DSM 1968]ODV60080.1 hypothetical protein ASCRUDRAFT_8850 [Ascoidea rubescens DSM 1968]